MTTKRGLRYEKYIGVINKCPKCGDKGYLELWKSFFTNGNSMHSFVFRVQHRKGWSKKGKHATYRVCWLTNEQANSLYDLHKIDYMVSHRLYGFMGETCHICEIYSMSGNIVPIHGASYK